MDHKENTKYYIFHKDELCSKMKKNSEKYIDKVCNFLNQKLVFIENELNSNDFVSHYSIYGPFGRW